MKNKILLFALALITLASCSTAYRSGQTPDDLYYAKGKTVAEENSKQTVEQPAVNYEDHAIRMSAYDRRWRSLDDDYDYNCSYHPYAYGYSYGYYYNPYYCHYPVYSYGTGFTNPKNTAIRTVNLNAYNSTMVNYVPTKLSTNTRTTIVRGYNNDNNTYTPRTSNTDTRTYTPSATPSSTSTPSNNSSSGSSVSRPARGN